MKRVLVLAYAFPPVGGAGVQRVSKHIKYLGAFGWSPVVVAPANPSTPLSDPTLSTDIPPGTEIIRTRTLEPSYDDKRKLQQAAPLRGRASPSSWVRARMVGVAKALLLPDPQVLWWPLTLRPLLRIIRDRRVDVVFASGPPFSVLLLAVAAGRLAGVPVVVDFRDEWGFSRQNWENMTRNRLVSWIDFRMERWVLSHCADFTAATSTYVTEIHARHPLSAAKGHVVTNGFDPEDFTGLPARVPSTGKLRLLYVGTVWSATSLRPLLSALGELVAENPALADRVELSVVGRVVDAEAAFFEEGPLAGKIHLPGYKSHREVIELMAGADVLLLTLADLPGADRILPGKIFEYMASGPHVLALVPPGEVSRLLEESGVDATVVSPAHVGAIKKALLGFLAQPPKCAESLSDGVLRFSREALTEKLAGVLDRVSRAG